MPLITTCTRAPAEDGKMLQSKLALAAPLLCQSVPSSNRKANGVYVLALWVYVLALWLQILHLASYDHLRARDIAGQC